HTMFSRDWSSDVCSSDLARSTVRDAHQSNSILTGSVFLAIHAFALNIPIFKILLSSKFPLTGSGSRILAVNKKSWFGFTRSSSEIGRASCREREENGKAC